MKLNKINMALLLLCMLAAFDSTYSANKQSVFNSLKKQYKNLKSISLVFSPVDSKQTFKLSAKKGNFYRIEMNDRIIVCDSKTVSNYSILDKNVMISTFDPDVEVFSIEKIFFGMLDNFKASSLSSHLSTKDKAKYKLKLSATTANSSGIVGIDLYLSNDYKTIKIIELHSAEGKTKWKINSLKFNPRIRDVIFKLKENKELEIIDMR